MSEATIHLGDCLALLPELPRDAAIVSDPPFGLSFRKKPTGRGHQRRENRKDYAVIRGDDRPFDPAPWLGWPCLLWGANHFAASLPRGGSWLAWDKSCGKGPADSFADCEFAWCSTPGVKRNIFRYLWKGVCQDGEKGQARYHPNQKPLALMRWSIERLGLPPGTTIIDPYMGSGTTILAAMQLGYPAIGIEVDPCHFETAQRRIAVARSETPLFA